MAGALTGCNQQLVRMRGLVIIALFLGGVASGSFRIGVRSGDLQETELRSLFRDEFDRSDTDWQDSGSDANAIGLYGGDWAIAGQRWRLEDGTVAMQRIDPGAGLLLWQAGQTASGDGTGFDLQAEVTLGVPNSTAWVGVAFHARQPGEYYALRYSGAGTIQLLRYLGGSPQVLASAHFNHEVGHPYRLAVSSVNPGVFAWSVSDLENGVVVSSGVAVDDTPAEGGGKGGLFSNTSAARFRTFRLQINDTPDVPKTVNGTPTLFDGDSILAAGGFSTRAHDNPVAGEQVRKATLNGVEIMFLRNICRSLHRDHDGVLSVDGPRLDQGISDVLADDPGAKIFISIGGLHPPQSWYAYYAEEPRLTDYNGNRSVFPDPASPIYRERAAAFVSNVVSYVEAQPYADSVKGYHLKAFEGGEWQMPSGYWGYSEAMREAFQEWLEERYQTIHALEAAWGVSGLHSFSEVHVPGPEELTRVDRGPFRDPLLRRSAIDFSEFWQEIGVRLLLDLCRTIKEVSTRENKPLVGAFYGYMLETGQTVYKGHHALRRVLDSPWIDFLAAPYSYAYRLPAWLGIEGADIGAGMFHGPVDSILANGKFFFSEDDSRTFLTDDEWGIHFTNATDTAAQLRRNQLAALVRGAGIWRLDLFGDGWYDSSELMREIGLQRQLEELLVSEQEYASRYAPEVALIIDEKSALYVATIGEDHAGPRIRINQFLRDHLARAGINYGVYLLSDLVAGRVPDCAVYVFAGTYRVSRTARAWIEENLKRDGKTLIWLYGSGLYDETGWGLGRMRDLTGFEFVETPQSVPAEMEPSVEMVEAGATGWSGTGIAGHPEWTMETLSPDAQVLAWYVHGATRRPAMVREARGGWTSIYAGTLRLEACWALGLMRLIDVHRFFDSDQTVPVYAGRGIIGLWPTEEPTEGIVRLKAASDVYELHTGKLLHQGVTHFPVTLPQWQTAAFVVRPPGEPWRIGQFIEWQQQHFGWSEITAGLADKEADPDGDGKSNWSEFVAGTDPRCASSVFAFHLDSAGGDKGHALFHASSGRRYSLYRRADLVEGAWERIGSVTGTGAEASLTITNDLPSAFYRMGVKWD